MTTIRSKGTIMNEVPRPLMLGYVKVTVYTGSKERAELARSLTEFADRERFALGELFVQSNMMRDGSALVALAEAATARSVTAICVPDITHLGDTEMLQRETRRWLENKTGLPVLAAVLG